MSSTYHPILSSAIGPVSVPDEVAPQLVDFKPPRYSFVLHNASAYEKAPMFGGNMFILPPRDVVGPLAELDSDGDPIPGTRVIEDLYGYDESKGDDVIVLDARKAVRHILGLVFKSGGTDRHGKPKDPTSEATSAHALSGISLLPRRPSKDLWKGIAKAGEHRAFLASISNAEYVVRSADETNMKRKGAGMDPVHGGRAYDEARAILEEYHRLVKKDVLPSIAPYADDEIEADLELEAFMKAKVMEMLEKQKDLTSDQRVRMMNDWLSDPKTRGKFQKLYDIKKRGYRKLSADELNSMAEAEEKIEEPTATDALLNKEE